MDNKVIIDRNLSTTDKLSFAGVGYVNPPSSPASTQMTSLGNGLVLYYIAFNLTGAANAIPIQIPKPHRFVRCEMIQLNSSSQPDTTGVNIFLARQDPNFATQPQIKIFSTNGNQAVASVVFTGGTAWEADGSIYILSCTGQNNDSLQVRFYVQYI